MKSVLRIITGLFVCLFLMLPIFAAESVSPFNDPHYSQQWALEAINWLPVWQQGLTGKGVKIGIIDTGANSLHEDLQGASLQGSNFIGAQSETFADDKIGHGTFVAGVIAAQPNNGKGIVGIAPDVELYIYRGYDGKLPPILAAIDQAIADGCQIINFSLGATEAALKESYSVLQQGIQKVQDAGILAVAAAGNSRPNATVTLYPAGFAGVLGVGSVNENLERSSFSQTNSSVFVVAPGEKLVSVSHNADDKYVTGGGTSYAAPVVTAVAALALDYDPTLTPAEIMEMMRLTATDLGEPGYDIFYGYGLVNGAALIEGLKSHFPVRYQLMGGAFAEEVPLFYSVLEGAQQLPEPVCEGHDFAGWYADEDRTVAIAQIAAGTTDAQVLYAKWEANGQGLCSDAAGDGDHLCEICGADGASSCEDPDRDHTCDECGFAVGKHEAAEGTHTCGHCGETMTECADVDKNHVCDICGAAVGSHEAAEGTHVCDYCGETMAGCADGDKNHICDICGAAVGIHEAAEGTHVCGHCGETMTKCADVDKNHVCDICGAAVGNHEAAEGTHVCGHCGETMSECADVDKNHVCDICGAAVGSHEAAEGTHVCGHCGETMTKCADVDKNHVCDICGAAVGSHEAAEGTHVCDYCGETMTECADGDKNHICDICGAAVGIHEAAEGTHTCGHCGETMTECADVDKNHVCDICGTAVGIHEAAEGTHTCGHCGETMSACADSEDLDTQCDICGKNLLQIRVEGGLLVVENNANIQLIIAEYDVYGKMLGVHIVTESANVPICRQTRVFTLDKNHVPQLPWLEVNTDSTAVQ